MREDGTCGLANNIAIHRSKYRTVLYVALLYRMVRQMAV